MNSLLKPPRLRSGDRVAVVSPSSPFKRDEFDRGIAEIERLGFEPVFDDRVFARHGGYLSGTAAARAASFVDAWRDPSIRALIAVRGGYGSVHLLPLLEPEHLRASPKIFVGYSDLTTLLTFLTIDCGIASFHGPMLDRRLGHGTAAYDEASFLQAVTNPSPLGALTVDDVETFKPGEASGALVGGTLTQLVASLGTPYAFRPPQSHVLFLEDVAERPYRLDRMMTQLRLAGVLDSAAAIVFGEFRDCDEPGGEPSARLTLAELVKDFEGPVLYGFPSGHASHPLVTLPFGVRARVSARGAPRLIIEEGAVS